MRLKDVAYINRHVLPETTDPDYSFRYIDISAVDSRGAIAIPNEPTRFESAPSRARRLAPVGSTIVSTVRTYLRAIAQVPPTDGQFVFSTGFAVIEANPSIEKRYLSYVCRSGQFVDGIVSRSVGVSYPAISPSDIGGIAIPLPPIDEQRRIADFLDGETAFMAKIEILRSRQEEVLKRRRWSMFQHLIDNAPCDFRPLRRLLHSITDGPFGSAFSSSDYTDRGAAVVRLGNIGFSEYRPQDQARIPMWLFEELRKYEVKEGDMLIAGLGDPRNHAGRACIAPDLGPAIVKGKCFRARVDREVTSSDFVALLLSSPIGASALEGRGSTRSMINLEIFKSAILPIPSRSDQVAIVEKMDSCWKSALAAIQACDRQLVILAERRQALITAAVTGQIDVTTAGRIVV